MASITIPLYNKVFTSLYCCGQETEYLTELILEIEGRDAIGQAPGMHKKTPAYAVLTTFLNQLKSGSLMLPRQAFRHPLQRASGGHAHSGQGKVPGSKVLAQKTNVNHAHRRG